MNLEYSVSEANDISSKSIVDADFEKSTAEVMDFERQQRQFLNELAVKRNQVDELKKELDAANLKIHELSRSLELARNTIEDHQHNLNLTLKNKRFLEDRLQNKSDSISRSHLHQESAVQERQHLRELLQKAELQNYNLIREVKELKAQHECDAAYQKDILNQDAKMRAKIAEITEAIQKFQVGQNEVLEMANKLEVWEELQKTSCFYREQFYKSKKAYIQLEEKFIKANAAVKKFEELMQNEKVFNSDLEVQIIITQWEKSTEWFNKQSKAQHQIIENLTIHLQSEKAANAKLCKHVAEVDAVNHDLQTENEVLRAKLKNFENIEVQTSEDMAKVNLLKTEIIEISDV